MIACPDCGLLERLPSLPAGSWAECRLCRQPLERTSGRSMDAALACSVATLIFLAIAISMPVFGLSILGQHSENLLLNGISALWRQNWLLLAGLSGLFLVVMPFLRFGLLAITLTLLKMGRRPAWLGRVFRWSLWLDAWAMSDVMLVALGVAYFRLEHSLTVEVLWGTRALVAAAFLTMLTRATLDRRTVWRALGPESTAPRHARMVACVICDLVQPTSHAGTPCPRCGATLHLRKPKSLERTTALLAAAFVLIFPANFYPMNISHRLGRNVTYTIFHGVHALFAHGLWALGVVIFCTSIIIPVVKIAVLGWCVWSVRSHSSGHLVLKTRLHRLINELGRWSCVDPFTIVLFVPLMNFGALASSSAGWGSTAFIAVVVLTMVATRCFDSRLLWDAAGGQPA